MAVFKYLGSDNKYHALPIGETITATEPESYSTEEQVIGQWIDGKPIYRKVFKLKSPSTANTDTVIHTFDFTIDTLIHYSGNLVQNQSATYNRDMPINYYYTADYNIASYVKKDDNTIHMKISKTDYANYDVNVVLEYTKVSDDPNSFSIDMLTTMDLDSKATAAEVAYCV